MIKKQNSCVFYITDEALSIQSENGILKEVSFPHELVKDKKILDKEALTAYISDQIQDVTSQVKDAVVVIGKGILFQISLDNDDVEKEKKFFESMPYETDLVAQKRIKTPTKEYIIATNKEYFETICTVLERKEIKIKGVVPLSLFIDEVDEKVLEDAHAKLILEKTLLYQTADFYTTTPSTVPVEKHLELEKEVKPLEPVDYPYTLVKRWNTTLLLAVLGFLMVSLVVFGLFLFTQKEMLLQAGDQSEKVATNSLPSPTSTPTPSMSVGKSDLTILILNGTGQAGQAGKVRALFDEDEFGEISTGNADSTDNESATVSFSDDVSEVVQEDVVKKLEELFEKVTKATDKTQSEDIVITTGTEI